MNKTCDIKILTYNKFFVCGKILLFAFLDRFSFIYPIFISLFKLNGSSSSTIVSYLILHNLWKILLDTHTGAFADRYGRSNVICLGLILKATGIMCWILYKSNTAFAVGMAIIGIGRACVAGKFDAYIYNALMCANMVHVLRKIMIARYVVCNISAVICGALCGYMCKFNSFDSALWLGFYIITFVHLPFTFFFMREVVKDNFVKLITIKQTILQSVRQLYLNKILSCAALSAASSFSLFVILTDLHKILMSDMGLKLQTIGLVYSLTHFLPMLTSLTTLYFDEKINKRLLSGSFLCLLSATLLLAINLASYANANYSLYAIIVYFALNPFIDGNLKALFQECIVHDTIRSTISSFVSLISSILNIVLFLMIGLITHYFDCISAIKFTVTLFFIIKLTLAIRFIAINKKYNSLADISILPQLQLK